MNVIQGMALEAYERLANSCLASLSTDELPELVGVGRSDTGASPTIHSGPVGRATSHKEFLQLSHLRGNNT